MRDFKMYDWDYEVQFVHFPREDAQEKFRSDSFLLTNQSNPTNKKLQSVLKLGMEIRLDESKEEKMHFQHLPTKTV